MKESGTKNCSYILMLTLSFMLAALLMIFMHENPEKKWMLQRGLTLFTEDIMQIVEREPSMEDSQTAFVDIPDVNMEQEVMSEEREPEITIEELPAYTMYEADVTYFDDALFIGDSRTVGLSEYGELGNAEVFAETGMSVYKIFQKKAQIRSGEKVKLEDLLSQRQFGKIYIMLGINELGYDFEYTVGKYQEMLTRIQELQPEAILFLEANLHISKKKSDTSDVYNNDNIDRFNQAVSEMADEKTKFYLDVNELFDDGEGNLAEEFTADDAHILGKYYPEWVDWLLDHAVCIE